MRFKKIIEGELKEGDFISFTETYQYGGQEIKPQTVAQITDTSFQIATLEIYLSGGINEEIKIDFKKLCAIAKKIAFDAEEIKEGKCLVIKQFYVPPEDGSPVCQSDEVAVLKIDNGIAKIKIMNSNLLGQMDQELALPVSVLEQIAE